MPKTVTPVNQWPSNFIVPNDTEDADSQSLEDVVQPIVDALEYLKNPNSFFLAVDVSTGFVTEGAGPFTGSSGRVTGSAGLSFARLSTPAGGSTDSISATIAIPRPPLLAGKTVTVKNALFYFGGDSDGQGCLIAANVATQAYVNAASDGIGTTSLYYGENTLVAGDMNNATKEWAIAAFDENATGALPDWTFPEDNALVITFDFYPKARTATPNYLTGIVLELDIGDA